MTEEKIQEVQQVNVEPSENDENCESWGTLVTKSTVRLKIWQILRLFGELNVTQISNLLKESKSTVSRHLNGMEKDCLVKSHEQVSTCEGRIAAKVFRINEEVDKIKSGMDQNQGLPKDFTKRIEFMKSEIRTNRSSIEMISGIMNLLVPIYDEVAKLLKINTTESLQKADEIFTDYMWGDKGEHITWFKFNYFTPKMYHLKYKIQEWSYKALKEDADPEKIEKERLELQTKLKEAKTEQKDDSIPKKYGVFGIEMPLRKIFKKNLSK